MKSLELLSIEASRSILNLSKEFGSCSKEKNDERKGITLEKIIAAREALEERGYSINDLLLVPQRVTNRFSETEMKINL